MGKPSKAWPIDPTGRVWITEAADDQIATASVQVDDEGVVLTTSTSGLTRRKLLVRNMMSTVVYIGDADVTAAAGFPLFQLDEIEIDVTNDAIVKAITSSGQSSLVQIMEVG